MTHRDRLLTAIALLVALSGEAGSNNPSDDEFRKAADKARVSISQVKSVYACWHSGLGSEHKQTHKQMLTVARASIQKAKLEGHTSNKAATDEALRVCREATGKA